MMMVLRGLDIIYFLIFEQSRLYKVDFSPLIIFVFNYAIYLR